MFYGRLKIAGLSWSINVTAMFSATMCSRQFSTPFSIAWLSSAIVGFNRSSRSSRSCRRGLAHGANRRQPLFSSRFSQPDSYSAGLRSAPRLASDSSSRCVPAPPGDGATKVAVPPDFPARYPDLGKIWPGTRSLYPRSEPLGCDIA
jgi:hypothetical protein